ncbi:MAG: hypothetical protein ABJJ37_20630 [Roseibium sp.]
MTADPDGSYRQNEAYKPLTFLAIIRKTKNAYEGIPENGCAFNFWRAGLGLLRAENHDVR